MTNLTIYRGDTQNYVLSFTDSSGNAVDITGWTVFMTVKTSYDVGDSEATISKDVTIHTDAAGGQTTITLSSTDTDVTPQSYVYDIQTKDDSDNIQTVMSGTFRVVDDVTRRTS